jgi:hypothetical protein
MSEMDAWSIVLAQAGVFLLYCIPPVALLMAGAIAGENAYRADPPPIGVLMFIVGVLGYIAAVNA